MTDRNPHPKQLKGRFGHYPGHYERLASEYDQFFDFLSRVKADFIQRFVPLSKDDQLVDVGGGTAQVSLMIHSDLGMTNPVVCVDPSQEMLKVAEKNGAKTIHSTAEDFLVSGKTQFPLKVVLMIGCIHHFQDINLVFSKLSECMPENGVCFIVQQPPETTLPLFRAAKQAFADTSKRLEPISEVLQTKGFQCKIVRGVESVQLKKGFWYSAIRNRVVSGFERLSDEELEQGIKELEEEFSREVILKFDLAMEGIVVQKSNNTDD